MNISATELKHALKKLSLVQTENFFIGSHGISAQDSDIFVVVNGVLSQLGDFNLSGKKFTQVVNRMSGTIDITKEERKLILKSAKAQVELEIAPTKSLIFPESSAEYLSFKLPEFKKALSVSSASASPNKSAAYGGVVQIYSIPLGMEEISIGYRVVGTDGNVLTLVKVIEEKSPFSILLNLKAAQTIQLMDGDVVSIKDSEKNLEIVGKGITIYASKPVQKYPNFDSFMSLQPKIKIQFDPAEWLNALKTVEPLIDETVDQGTVALHFKDSVIQFSNIGVGSTAKDEASYEQIDPDPVFEPMSFNTRLTAKYISGFLSKAKNPSILELISSDKPVKFESDGISVFTMAFKKKEVK
jgi:DNA polymerase III sliding clamp (beta) subunit (PCNA family)